MWSQFPPLASWLGFQVYGSLLCLVFGSLGFVWGGLQFLTLTQHSQLEIISDNLAEENDSNLSESPSNSNSPELLTIDVSGAVASPGLYHVPSNSRVGQVLEQAGGVTTEASQVYLAQKLNLAEVVKDGQKIYIPTEVEYQSPATLSNNSTTNTNTQSPNDSAFISLNSASQAQLESLPGIGAVRAQQIIQHRPYSSIQELVEQGIVTETIFSDIQPKISL